VLALLGKWCWRMLVDRGGLWHRVLVARYGEVNGKFGGWSGSSWWKEVAKIRDRDGVDGSGWFEESVVRKVGDGRESFFWTDVWLGGQPLCRRFRLLFDLAKKKSFTIATMHVLGWEEGGAGWRWRRRLWVWEEEMLEECKTLLSDISLQNNVLDHWQWRPDPSRGYSV
jgi:hypothetical protein